MTDTIRSFPDGARVQVAQILAQDEAREVNELWLPRYKQAALLATHAAHEVKRITPNSEFTAEERSDLIEQMATLAFGDYLSYRRYEDHERREAQPDIAAPSPQQEPSA